jgi:hypothetical protein
MIVRHRLQSGACALFAAAAAVAAVGVAFADPAPDSSSAGSGDASAPTQPGSWQTRQSDFWFMGFTATYSCDGLSEKVLLLLRQVGARSDAKVVPLCTREFGQPDKFAEVKLTFASLQPAVANNSTAANQAVPGVWRHVELAPNKPFSLQGGDCELIEQFRDKLLPLFATRNLENKVSCVPHQDAGNQYQLSFDVFAPATAPKKP